MVHELTLALNAAADAHHPDDHSSFVSALVGALGRLATDEAFAAIEGLIERRPYPGAQFLAYDLEAIAVQLLEPVSIDNARRIAPELDLPVG